MLVFGLIYAVAIAIWPFKAKNTWKSVVIGDFVTDVGDWAILLLLTGNIWISLTPFICHLLTGGPMIGGQILKHALQNGGHIVIDEEEIDHGHAA